MKTKEVNTTTSDISSITLHPQSTLLRRGLQVTAVCLSVVYAGDVWIKSHQQDTARLASDTRVVVRLPKSLFAELTQNELREEFPIREQAGSMAITGDAVATGRISIDIEPDTVCHAAEHAMIAVRVEGQTEKSLIGQQSNVTVIGTGRGKFEAVKKLHFDGREFTSDGKPLVTASHETEIEDVQSISGGAFRLLASRKARAAVPSVNEIAVARIKERVAERVDEIVESLLTELNVSNRLSHAIAHLHPSNKGWRILVSAGEDLVQAALVPDGGQLPELPSMPADDVEVWVRLTPSERVAMKLLQLGNQVDRVFAAILPGLDSYQLAESLHVAARDDWTLLQFAKPARARKDV